MISAAILLTAFAHGAEPSAVIGSKTFTESYVLGELAAQTLEDAGSRVDRRFGLGGTGILFEAILAGQIDAYPEYTGTIAESLLKDGSLRDFDSIQKKLKPLGLVMSIPLGFSNTYALAARKEYAAISGITAISDLRAAAKNARIAFSHEFVTRRDGLEGLSKAYGLAFPWNSRSMEHSLAYRAIENGEADLLDVYSTDARIAQLGLVPLVDDRGYFPSYTAVWLARSTFTETCPRAWAALQKLGGKIDVKTMISMNAAVDINKKSFAQAARAFAHTDGATLGQANRERKDHLALLHSVFERTKEHLFLVGFALLFSICVGMPLGALAAHRPGLGRAMILGSSIVQTIPSLALLCLLIPVFGIGAKPALAALCLYGLLPVVLSTFSGMRSIDRRLLETARAIGLAPWRRILRVELPLASVSILAGVKTSAIIGIGTATLAALVGAGGYGAPIVAGLAINDMHSILAGAIPAALMALLAHLAFEVIERVAIPKGLR